MPDGTTNHSIGELRGEVSGIKTAIADFRENVKNTLGELRDNIQQRYSETRVDMVHANEARQRLYDRLEAIEKGMSARLNTMEQTIAEVQNDLADIHPTVLELNKLRLQASGAGWAAGRIAGWVYVTVAAISAVVGWAISHIFPAWWKP